MALRRVALGVARRVLAPVEAGIFTESAHARHHSRCVRFCSSTGGSGRDDEDGESTDDPAAGSDPEVRSPAWNVPDDAPAPETDATASTADDDAEIASTSSSNEHSTNKKSPFVPFFVRKAGENDSNAAAPSKQRGAAARRKPTTAPPDESQNLYVKNLPPDFSAAKLANLFLQHGDVLSTKFVAAEPTAGRPAPTGLVRFATRAEAEAAMAQLNGVKLGGDGVGPATEPLEVSVAMSKEQREAQYAERKAAREERMEKRKAWLAKQAEWAQKMKERDARRAAFANRVSIHVRDAPRGLDAESTAKIFKPFGDVARVKLWFANGASPTAVLSMGSAEEAAAAIAMLSGRKLEGCAKPMTITVHKPGNKGDKDGEKAKDESEPTAILPEWCTWSRLSTGVLGIFGAIVGEAVFSWERAKKRLEAGLKNRLSILDRRTIFTKWMGIFLALLASLFEIVGSSFIGCLVDLAIQRSLQIFQERKDRNVNRRLGAHERERAGPTAPPIEDMDSNSESWFNRPTAPPIAYAVPVIDGSSVDLAD